MCQQLVISQQIKTLNKLFGSCQLVLQEPKWWIISLSGEKKPPSHTKEHKYSSNTDTVKYKNTEYILHQKNSSNTQALYVRSLFLSDPSNPTHFQCFKTENQTNQKQNAATHTKRRKNVLSKLSQSLLSSNEESPIRKKILNFWTTTLGILPCIHHFQILSERIHDLNKYATFIIYSI